MRYLYGTEVPKLSICEIIVGNQCIPLGVPRILGIARNDCLFFLFLDRTLIIVVFCLSSSPKTLALQHLAIKNLLDAYI